MTPFYPASQPQFGTVSEFAGRFKLSAAQAKAMIAELASADIRMNETHQVNITRIANPFNDESAGDMLWLSIKRRDKSPIHDWRELQEIKNMIVGAECEGFEIYPAESRLVDTANQYHLFVFLNPEVRLPVGWNVRAVADPDEAAKVGAVQRSFE
jgi:hypothetical protein